jgi:hypothetical protein
MGTTVYLHIIYIFSDLMEDHLRQYVLKPVLYHMMKTFFLKKQTKHLSADHTSTYFGQMLYVYI